MARAPQTEAPKTTTAPAGFDPSAFDVEDASAEDMVGHRTGKYEKHPWVPLLTDSYKEDVPKRLPRVPVDALDDVKRDLNGVAKMLGIGVKIRAKDNGDGTYAVAFTGQERRVVVRQPLTDEQKKARTAKREANKQAQAS